MVARRLHTLDVLEEIIAHNKALLKGAHLEFSSWQDVPGLIGDGAHFYHSLPVSSSEKLREDIAWLRRQTQRDDRDLGLCSRVTMWSGRMLYIPQIDFRARPEDDGQAQCLEKLTSVIGSARSGKTLPGYLLCSGQSYHYVGLKLLNQDDWLEFLGLCLLCEEGKKPERPSPVDRRWVGHSLIRGRGILRIFEKQDRPEPYVVAHVPAQ